MLTQPNFRRILVHKVRGEGSTLEKDALAVEEPLEIRLASDSGTHRIAVTMRTPGEDFELAAGFLYCEGVVRERDDIQEIRYCDEVRSPAQSLFSSADMTYNIVTVRLRPGLGFDEALLQRNFYTTSSCGVCGKASLEALEIQGCSRFEAGLPLISAAVVRRLDAQLRRRQSIFDKTGGLHAAALFDSGGQLLDACEDVGRHNALDKLIGRQFLDGRLAGLRQAGTRHGGTHHGGTRRGASLLMVSGRTSFEIMQKALMAGIPIVVAVGAPSSLAVELASQFHLTLVGFARDDGFNIYAAPERIAL
jgi:FdhD protein